jgi:tRNA threonylcarbamoyladenosine biosynthesis protein TsaB
MALFLTIHTRYKDVQLGLFNKGKLLDWTSDESKRISKNFIFLMRTLFERNKLSLSDLTFIAAHQGPAPFTTLRVSLASVNGLAFATELPLVGVNGLEVFLDEQHDPHVVTIAILNAFCQDVYYGIYNPFDKSTSYGYGAATTVLKTMAEQYKEAVTFIGNGVELYKPLIEEYFGTRAHIPPILPEIASLEAIGTAAFNKWQEKTERLSQLMPLYLKDHSALVRTHCQPSS